MTKIENVSKTSIFKDITYLLIKIFVILFTIWLIFTLVFGISKVSDNSMRPSIKAGDIVSFYRLDSSLLAGDSVVVDSNGKTKISRIIAVPGDTVDINEKGVQINGHLETETSLIDISGNTDLYTDGMKFPITLGKNKFFLLGDNREKSVDSRYYGPVDKKNIKGKLIFVFRNRNL